MKTYLTGIAVISLILLAAIPLESYLGFELHQFYSHTVIFFMFQSLVISYILSVGERDREKFPLYALGALVFRLVTAVVLLIILFIVGVKDATGLAIQFMVIYLSFLMFELTVVLTNLRRN